MAFRQPQRQQPRPVHQSLVAEQGASAPARQRSPSPEPREWILFSAADASDSYDRSEHAAGRLSDFDSLDTPVIQDNSRDRQAQDEDNEDLDSLDDGLHEFSSQPIPGSYDRVETSRDTVLPAHDGLGMFPGDSSPVQDQFWQHEKHNPARRRHSHRTLGVQHTLGMLQEEASVQPSEDDKTLRIEQWRMEQSKAILEEIEKETRRRKRRTKSAGAGTTDESSLLSKSAPEKASVAKPSSRTECLSFWERITRRVIRDLIGIDDATLEYIFGEALPQEPESVPPTQDTSAASAIVDFAEQAIIEDHLQPAATSSSWEERLLSRISKELGILLSHISEHPGAFNTYLQTQEVPPYAGLPTPAAFKERSRRSRRSTGSIPAPLHDEPTFAPTLIAHQRHGRHSAITTDPSLWGIEEEEEPSPLSSSSGDAARLQREKEYWERDLDVKMVFGFLRNKLTSSSAPTPTPSPPPEPVSASVNQHDSLRRAALIRHHHPLVSRNVVGASASHVRPAPQARLSSGSVPSKVWSNGAPLSPILGRRSSRRAETESYASQSTKRSRTGRSGSSRNYWDLGGCSDGASATYSAGWGEV